jgi:predicted DNA-binding transcriptional regulator AlpA
MSSDLELLDRRAVCAVFGGIHPATLYRHVRAGTIARPVKVGALSRWLRSEVEASLAAMIEGRAQDRSRLPSTRLPIPRNRKHLPNAQ